MTGIIIGFGYQFKKTISASVKKSVARESRIYSNNLFSTMSMPIIEEVRTTTKEGSIYDRKQVGTVTEKFVESIESKDDPMKMNKVMIIYMLDPKNIDGLLIGVQVQGQARYHIENNKLITSRSANYITTISLPDEPSKVSDFWDVFLPDFKTGDRWDASIRSVVQEKVNSVHAFLNNISPTVEIDAPKELTADDIKNVFGDLPF